MTQWSLPKLRQYLIEQKVVASISIRWLGEILRRYKVRLRRTKTWKESTDPLFVKKYRAIRRLYRRRPANGRRLCIDEFGPLHLVPLAATHPGSNWLSSPGRTSTWPARDGFLECLRGSPGIKIVALRRHALLTHF
jgi:hypothetical protein